MKKLKVIYICAAIVLNCTVNLTTAQVAYDLNKYYTSDIIRNQLDLNLNFNSRLDQNTQEYSVNNSLRDYSAYNHQGRLGASLYNYIHTRKLLSTLGVTMTTHNVFTGSQSDLLAGKDQPTFQYIHKSRSSTNSVEADWNNNRYLSSRLFIQYKVKGALSLNSSSTTELDDEASITKNETIRNSQRNGIIGPQAGVGYGRIERVEDARQALYIFEKLKKNGRLLRDPEQDEIFRFAQVISSVKNKRFLDSRLHWIDEMHTVDEFLAKNQLIDETDMVYFTTLNDMWMYGGLHERKAGYKITLSYGGQYNYSRQASTKTIVLNPGAGYSTSDLASSLAHGVQLSGEYEKPAGLNWQHSFHTLGHIQTVNGKFNSVLAQQQTNLHLQAGYKLGYYPTTRTYLNASLTHHYRRIKEGASSTSNETRVSGNIYYYLSPQVKIAGAFQVMRFWDNTYTGYLKSLTNQLNVSISYSIF